MIFQGQSSEVMRKRLISDKILHLIDFAISGGCQKWADNVTHSANKTLTMLFSIADAFTVDVSKTLTLSQLRPFIVVANTITINGTITASGKGCSGGSADKGYKYSGTTYPFDELANEIAATQRNFCLCGSGGGGEGSGAQGGGAYAIGGVVGGNGVACDLTAAELKEFLLSPFATVHYLGYGGGGGKGTSDGGDGGGQILLIAKTIVVSATGSVIADGVAGVADAATDSGGGGGGFVGLIGDTLSIHGSATLTANGGAAAASSGAGGNGAVVQMEV